MGYYANYKHGKINHMNLYYGMNSFKDGFTVNEYPGLKRKDWFYWRTPENNIIKQYWIMADDSMTSVTVNDPWKVISMAGGIINIQIIIAMIIYAICLPLIHIDQAQIFYESMNQKFTPDFRFKWRYCF